MSTAPWTVVVCQRLFGGWWCANDSLEGGGVSTSPWRVVVCQRLPGGSWWCINGSLEGSSGVSTAPCIPFAKTDDHRVSIDTAI